MNDIPKIVKLLMDTVNYNDTDQNIDRIETPTVEETEVKSITQELQNNIGMQSILCMHCTRMHAEYMMHTLYLHTQSCTLMCDYNQPLWLLLVISALL